MRGSCTVARTALVGIDLGTSNCTVACLEDGHAVVVPAADGRRSTPSVISLAKVLRSQKALFLRSAISQTVKALVTDSGPECFLRTVQKSSLEQLPFRELVQARLIPIALSSD